MSDDLRFIQDAIAAGDKVRARKFLAPLLKNAPTIEMWLLAAEAADSREVAIHCLKQALKIDPLHTKANRLLLNLESAPTKSRPPKNATQPRPAKLSPTIAAEAVTRPSSLGSTTASRMRPQEFQRATARRRSRTLTMIGFVVLMMGIMAVVIANALGMTPGLTGFFVKLTGGNAPITEIDGAPLEEYARPIQYLPVTDTQPLEGTRFGLLDHGYVHEYYFRQQSDYRFSINVNFLTLLEGDYWRDVAVYDGEDRDVTSDKCTPAFYGPAAPQPPGVTLICFAGEGGTWAVRILGMAGESVGAYTVTYTSLGQMGIAP